MNPEPSRINGDDELYVGGITSLSSTALQANKITHILSALGRDLKNINIHWDEYQHLQIEIDDWDEENILGEFEKTGQWIEDALKTKYEDGREGRVLIHCAMGQSRSVTLLIAYLIRQYPHHTPYSALALINETRPFAEPNEGFREQLKLYYDWGCPRNLDDCPQYQRWLYAREVEIAIRAGSRPDRVRFEDEEVQGNEKGVVEGKTAERAKELRCRMCRRTLCMTPYLKPHLPSPPKSTTAPISSLPPPSHQACSHHFLEPLSWMRSELDKGELSGRLECPNEKCTAQIGKYAWQGMRCSCGVWVCPAFSLLKGRCDEIIKRDSGSVSAGSGGIRMPPGMLKGKGSL